MFRVRMEQHIGEELLEAVPSVSRSVLHVRPHRLVQLHQELLRWRAQLLNHLVPLVDILGFSVRKSADLGLLQSPFRKVWILLLLYYQTALFILQPS